MTTMLSRVAKPKIRPPRICVFGGPGVGKTTLACDTKAPVIVPIEEGADAVGVDAFPRPQDIGDVLACIKDLLDGEHNFKTVIFDALDGLEKLIWAQVCADYGKPSIEEVLGGFHKGYRIAAEKWWPLFFDALDGLRAKRDMTVFVIAHALPTRIEDPSIGVYMRTEPQLHRWATPILHAWADCIFYMEKRRYNVTHEDGKGRKMNASTATGERVLYTAEQTGFYAKSRWTMPAEIVIPEKNPFGVVRAELSKAMNGASRKGE
jgi:hypothetical protein